MDDDTKLEAIRDLTRAAESCYNALESKGMISAMQIAQVHGFPYNGPKVHIPRLQAAIRKGRELLGEPPFEACDETPAPPAPYTGPPENESIE